MTETPMVLAAGMIGPHLIESAGARVQLHTKGPYEPKVPRTDAPVGGYPSAEQELAAALEGQAPMLAREVAPLLGPHRTVMLARAISRAVAVGIRRRAEAELADRMQGLHDLLASGLDQVTDGCTTPEAEADV